MIPGFSVLTQHKHAKAALSVAMLLAMLLVAVGINTALGNGDGANAATGPKKVQGQIVASAVAARGSVDLAKAPQLTAKSASAAALTGQRLPFNLPLPAAQRAKVIGGSHSVPQGGTTANRGPTSIRPNFVSGGTVPPITGAHEGIDYSQSGGWYPPDQALTIGGGCCILSNQYVVEGVNNAIAIYNPSYGAFGVWSSSTLFASVMLNGDFLADPQITWDSTRERFVIVYLELHSCGASCISHGYIDLAVSKAQTATGIPTNYWVYRIDVGINNNTEWCDYPTLGMEYWNLYVTCPTFGTNGGGFVGNRTWMFNKTGFYLANGSYHVGVFGSVNNDLNCGGGAGTCPVFRLAPATEDGVPVAEWIVGTDAGYGVNSSNLTLFAITNPNALASNVLPTGTYINAALPGSYADPPGAQQPGTSTLVDTGFASVKQFMYKGGRLWFSFATAILWNGDSATRSASLWTVIEPYLNPQATANPQIVAGFNTFQFGYVGYFGGYTYMPSLYPSDEGDATLVYNFSNANVYPSIAYTGRQNDDIPSRMGQGYYLGNSYYVIQGTHANGSGRWGDYSACSLQNIPSTRGVLYCGGEYGGSQAAANGVGWNTYLYTVRMV